MDTPQHAFEPTATPPSEKADYARRPDSSKQNATVTTAEPHQRRRSPRFDRYELLCARSILLWLIASGGTGLTIGIILVITWTAQPKAMRSTQSHNFISINSVQNVNPTPDTFLKDWARSVIPVPVHSHNDYWRPHPLYSALAAGCMGVEADVFLNADKSDLLVGHRGSDLSADRTLQSMYINPMKQILDALNPSNTSVNSTAADGLSGIYSTSPDTTVMLLIDVKGNATEIWPLVDKQLQPLRERGYLSTLQYNGTSNSTSKPVFRQGPITVVGTGNLAKSNVTGVGCDALSKFPDSFHDAPLGKLTDPSSFGTLDGCGGVESLLALPLAKYWMASQPLSPAIGPVVGSLSSEQQDKIRASMQVAQAKNLTSRYWNLPAWPISKRDYVWAELVDAGVGLLNADDIESATRLEWNRAYRAEVIWIAASSAYIFVASLIFAYLYDRSSKNRSSRDGTRFDFSSKIRNKFAWSRKIPSRFWRRS